MESRDLVLRERPNRTVHCPHEQCDAALHRAIMGYELPSPWVAIVQYTVGGVSLCMGSVAYSSWLEHCAYRGD